MGCARSFQRYDTAAMYKVAFDTFGCRLNTRESEVMAEHARAEGLGETVIINSCAVTSEAVRQSRQAVRKARREIRTLLNRLSILSFISWTPIIIMYYPNHS